MLRLRLFHRDEPGRQIESRPLGEGEIVVGRDAKADWAIGDAERSISRRHLVIANRGGMITLRDTSSNGVFLGEGRERVEHDRSVPIGRGEAIRFGSYVLVLEEDQHAQGSPATATGDNPFDDFDDGKAPEDRGRRTAAHPFASALKPDPLQAGGEVGNADIWEQRREAPAGTWDAVAPHRKPEHTTLIGADRQWSEPPPEPAREAGYGFDAPFQRPILEQEPVTPVAAAIPSDWMEAGSGEAQPAPTELKPVEAPPPLAAPLSPATPPPPVASVSPAPPVEEERKPAPTASSDDGGLFEHFCAGAGLNPQHFAGLERGRAMERLGGIYRQAVLGVADLMRERTSLRNEYRMVHTTVRPEGNNPFKWVPPQRIAVELLRDEDSGYTTGERALNDALRDVKAHLLCMLAGMRAALSATFTALQPAQVEAKLGSRSYLIAVQRDAALWAEYVAMAGALRLEADDNPDGLINRAFRQGYEDQAAALGNGRDQWR